MAKKSQVTKKTASTAVASRASSRRAAAVIAKPKATPKKTKTITKKAKSPKAKVSRPAKKPAARAAKSVAKPKAVKTAAKPAAQPKTTKPKAPKHRTSTPRAATTLVPELPAPPKAPACPKGYTPDEYAKYKDEKKRLASFGNKELKQMLKKNLQSMSGNKDEMIEKIADGIVLGRIPRCPSCFGGRPKYDSKTGIYHCSGYRDDEDFKNCHTDFTKEELKRDPWEA